MAKKDVMRLTVSGTKGFHPQVGGGDLVSDGGKVDDRHDVTAWLLNRLHELNTRAKQIVSDHLANLSGSGNL
jgi:hypothetical protein